MLRKILKISAPIYRKTQQYQGMIQKELIQLTSKGKKARWIVAERYLDAAVFFQGKSKSECLGEYASYREAAEHFARITQGEVTTRRR